MSYETRGVKVHAGVIGVKNVISTQNASSLTDYVGQ